MLIITCEAPSRALSRSCSSLEEACLFLATLKASSYLYVIEGVVRIPTSDEPIWLVSYHPLRLQIQEPAPSARFQSIEELQS